MPGTDRRSLGERIIVGDDENPPGAHHRALLKARRRCPERDEREVRTIGVELFETVGSRRRGAKFDGDPGMGGAYLRQGFHHEMAQCSAAGGDAKRAGFSVPELGEASTGGSERAEAVDGGLVEDFARGGRRDARPAPLDQGDVELPLEPLDVLAHCRLGAALGSGDAAEAAHLAHCGEDPKVLQACHMSKLYLREKKKLQGLTRHRRLVRMASMGPPGANRPTGAGPIGRSSTVAPGPVIVVDIGNSTTSLALIGGDRLLASANHPTDAGNADRVYQDWARELMSDGGVDLADLGGMAVACVVSAIRGPLRRLASDLRLPLTEIRGDTSLIPVGYDEPAEMGADRIANALGASGRYGTPVIAVDLGTAITIEVVSAAGELVGGAIAPGVGISLGALLHRVPHLPAVALGGGGHEGPALGRSTVRSLRAGASWGAAGLVDGLVRRSQEAAGIRACPVVATGGDAAFVAACSGTITSVDHDLTLWGAYRGHWLATRTSPGPEG